MKVAVIVIVVLAIAALGAGAFFLLREPAPAAPAGGVENPFGNAGGGFIDPGTLEEETVAVLLADGSVAAVPDFRGDAQPEGAGPEAGYQAAGSAEGDYQVLYFPDDSYFLVSIFAEPIGANRLRAEGELRSRLKLPDETLCKLNADVFVTAEANETYAGMNLGLSFCPGAVSLPG